MTKYTKEKCYKGMEKMGSDMCVALTRIFDKTRRILESGQDLSEQAGDTDIDCAIRLKIMSEMVGKVIEDFCK